MQDIKPYLEKAEQYHGHICSGQILGIRMTLMALKALGMSPQDDMRDLVIFLETDRCVADASYGVTGVTVGRRRVKKKWVHFFGPVNGKTKVDSFIGYAAHLGLIRGGTPSGLYC